MEQHAFDEDLINQNLLAIRQDASLDRITRLLRSSLNCDAALVTLLDGERQVFISQTGLKQPWGDLCETPLSHSFCQHVIAGSAVLSVPDARLHPLLKTNLAIPDLGVVGYLGVPIQSADGVVLGALCAITGTPRDWSSDDLAHLQDFAAIASNEIELRRQSLKVQLRDVALDDRQRRFGNLLTHLTRGICFFDRKGRLVTANQRYGEVYRLDPEDLVPGTAFTDILAKRRSRQTAPVEDDDTYLAWMKSDPSGAPLERDLLLQDGRTIRAVIRITDDGGWIATHEDVSEQVRTARESAERQALYQLLAENAHDVVVLANLRGRRTYFSPAVKRLFGYSPEEAIGVPVSEWVHPDELGFFRQAAAGLSSQKPTAATTLRIRHRDGHFVWADVIFRYFETPEDEPRVVCTVRDISRRMAIEAEYQSLFSNANVGLFRMTLDGRLVRANAALARLRGYPDVSALLAAATDDDMSWHLEPGQREAFLQAVIGRGSVTDQICRVRRHRDQAEIVVSKSGWLVPATAHQPAFIEGSVVDVTERIRFQESLQHTALHDPLTGLPNRLHLRTWLAARGKAVNANETSILLYLDLDRFKAVNDRYGHSAGDDCLGAVAARLREAMGGEPHFLARLGGDEFAVVMAAGSTPRDAEQLASRLIRGLSQPIVLRGTLLVEVGASVGLALFQPALLHEPQDILRSADIAMYEAKRAGGGAFAWYTDQLDEDVRSSLALEADLKLALSRGEFFLAYQPQVNLPEAELSGFEALLRWNHPTRGLVSPQVFVKLAEEIGLIKTIGRWVLEQACEELRDFPPHVLLSVNVAACQLHDPHFVPHVFATLTNSQIAFHRLELELTESMMVTSSSDILAKLAELRAAGIRIAIDDFGTGFSSLAYLSRFPFDRIKIDRSFVADLGSDTSERILRSILALGHSIGKQVLIEGIETPAQKETVEVMGCSQAQGYHFGRPMPRSAAVALATKGCVPHGHLPVVSGPSK